MITLKINLDSMEKIQTFVKIMKEYRGHVDLISGCNKVNAKSIMGIFSLDISRPLDLNIYNDEHADFVLQALSAYIVENERQHA